jgi:preprotein translocase subunit SecE
VARDRQRAKERRRRREESGMPSPSEPHRENVPGELEHASGEVDAVDAAIVSGADGETSDTSEGDLELAALSAPRADTPSDRAPARSGGPRFLVFLKASWAELQRVQWPDRRQVFQATAVVLGFVVIAGTYLGIADWAAQRLVNFIL